MPGRAGGGTRPYVVLFSPCVFFVRSGLEIRYLTTETLRHGENRAFLFLGPNAVWREKVNVGFDERRRAMPGRAGGGTRPYVVHAVLFPALRGSRGCFLCTYLFSNA
jgi:hypothetical protein